METLLGCSPSGFSCRSTEVIPPADEDRLERLARYLTRAPLRLDAVVEDDEGHIRLATTAGPSIRSAAILPGAAGTTKYLLGTSTGIYATTALAGQNTVWTEEGHDATGNAVVAMVRTRVRDGLAAASTHGRGLFVRAPDQALTVYESPDPADVIDPLYAVGSVTMSPHDRLPAVAPALYYQLAGSGPPPIIRLSKGGQGVLIFF